MELGGGIGFCAVLVVSQHHQYLALFVNTNHENLGLSILKPFLQFEAKS